MLAIFCFRDTIIDGGIAQLGEHMHHTHGVAGSSPVVSTIPANVEMREFSTEFRLFYIDRNFLGFSRNSFCYAARFAQGGKHD